MKDKPILITAGEPFGVFSEIFFKSFRKFKKKDQIILIASKDLLVKQMIELNYNYSFNIINERKINFKKLDKKKINIIDIKFNFIKPFDKISDKSNLYIKKCFALALKLLKKNSFSGFINGPISKKNFLKKKFSGITEYLASETKKKNVSMLIYNKKLSVSPITTHIPLKNVHKELSTKKIVDQVELIVKFYKKKIKKNPKIGITGLNPHCESNYNSSEEINIITPAIQILKGRDYDIKGPLPADTIFMAQQSRKFDVIVGMYHDQVLTPAKTIFNFNAINITLGLPFIRISPDHGPNQSMAGKNLSNPQSLIEALNFLRR
jgi:4-hydroxythreonine-4-phosphate dehydrogenase